MRKEFIILFICIFLISFQAFAAGLADSYTVIKDEVVETFSPTETREQNCPVYSDTPWKEIERTKWEVMIRVNLMDFPTAGSPALRTENFDLGLIHNLSSQLYAYVWYGNRDSTKNDYEGSAYDPEWSNRMVFGGFGFYFFPTIKVFAGAGKIWAVNENGDEPSLETSIERGIAIDYAIMGYKAELAYRFVDAQIADDSIPIQEATADGTFSSLSISLVIPIFN